MEYLTPRNLTVAYMYGEWEKFGELFAEHFAQANQAEKLSLLRWVFTIVVYRIYYLILIYYILNIYIYIY